MTVFCLPTLPVPPLINPFADYRGSYRGYIQSKRRKRARPVALTPPLHLVFGKISPPIRKTIPVSDFPIEQLFYAAYLDLITIDGHTLSDYELQREASIGRYRVDFLHTATGIVVECDSKAWHSSPEQIRYDNERRAFLTGIGYELHHFSGHAINIDAPTLAATIFARIRWRLDEKRYLVAARDLLGVPPNQCDPIANLREALSKLS